LFREDRDIHFKYIEAKAGRRTNEGSKACNLGIRLLLRRQNIIIKNCQIHTFSILSILFDNEEYV
jgi:hypothetical protein